MRAPVLCRLDALRGVQEASRAIEAARAAWTAASEAEDAALRRFDAGAIRFEDVAPLSDARERAWGVYQAALSAGELALSASRASRGLGPA